MGQLNMAGRITLVTALFLMARGAKAQLTNRAPHFVPQVGDMSKFSLSESTTVGTPVYQLKGIDPEGSTLYYSISGQQFTVDRQSGVVTLQQPLDRETQQMVEVIVSLTDEGIAGSEPNTVSLRREITVLDENDNAPLFHNRPYRANLSESAPIGSVILTTNSIVVTDKDEGVNADVSIDCYIDAGMSSDDDSCKTFAVYTEKISEGAFKAHISLLRQLDFEQRSAYVLTLRAADSGSKPLSAFASVAIDVLDVQDQPPVFINAPYGATVSENTPAGTSILTIKAKDGDVGSPRPLLLTIEGDTLGYFKLITEKGTGQAILVTSDVPLDRENSHVLQNGGIYTFVVKATELINNELPSESTETQVTVVITDVDDQIPEFNSDSFEINIPEDIQNDTPLPGLNIVVTDGDIGNNAKYELFLRDIKNSEGVFEVSPRKGEGRTPVVIKVIDNAKLDYDVEDISKRTLEFEIIAYVDNVEAAKTNIIVHLLDSNDNPPVFDKNNYRLHVAENSPRGKKIADINATDKDSGDYGKISYFLRGFGAEKFKTNLNSGGLYVDQNLDYENQKSYSLTLEAIDGGNRITSVNVFLDIDDVNDNHPQFESREYMRTVREGATSFEPQLFVHATDIDGPTQGGGKIFYSIESSNSISENLNSSRIFSIDSNSGEIRIERAVHSMDTPRGQYDLIIKATDGGVPSLHNETRVLIRVGIAGNQRPVFKGNYNSRNVSLFPGSNLMDYKATVQENAPPGTNVTTVVATDPDGIDSLLTYSIVGGHKDNFIIDKKSGLITTSSYSNFDLDTNPKQYSVVVNAVDNGLPIHETATATVYIMIEDVNDKPPIFNATNSTAYVSERALPGDYVIGVKAYDRDESSKLEYSIVEPIRAKDKTGAAVKSSAQYDYKNAFKITQDGDVLVNKSLSYNDAAVIILSVQVQDTAAQINALDQIARTELTIYIQAYSDDNPIFVAMDLDKINQQSHLQITFDQAKQTVNIKIPEEQPIGYKLLSLQARDPTTGDSIVKFKPTQLGTDPFTVLQNGEIILTKRLDYESLTDKVLNLKVEAISDDESRRSQIAIFVEVLDINDNAPVFERMSYKTSIIESARYPQHVLSVRAVDLDTPNTDKGYGDLRYMLHGENSNYFTIDPLGGVITVSEQNLTKELSPNTTLDRERQSVLRFNVSASDTPKGGPESLKATAQVLIDILDVNDNAPAFGADFYTAVVAENVNIGTSVINITATDPDEGSGGDIIYEILDEGESNGLFQINSKTGELLTKTALTGKGRTEPYLLMIRAQDGGDLFTDVVLTLYIGDILANDGVPTFIKPTPDQIAYVLENSTVGSPVFQIVATDPDDPTQPSGKLTYRLLNDGLDYRAFKIDSETGLLTTATLLDREKKDQYTLVLVVQDKGDPPQQATRILTVQVTDIDDHKPHFSRGLDDEPLSIYIAEGVPIGTEIGEIAAVDEDIGENGAIDYLITFGNEHNIFSIERTNDSRAIIKVANWIDREEYDQHLLTIKCFKASERKSQTTRKPYNRLDPSEIQVLIKVTDIDDNLPQFEKNNATIGVRLSVPVDTSILTIVATDEDSDALPINYDILNSTFTPLVDFGDRPNASEVFRLDSVTGDLRTGKSLIGYVDGFFTLLIRANNSIVENHHTNTTLQIYIIRDKDLLKFVFSKPPTEVRKVINEFERAVESLLEMPNIKLHIYDTQFHSKRDNSLDFSSTSSCFQLVGPETLTTDQMTEILSDETLKGKLNKVYEKYHVNNVERCTLRNVRKAETTITQLWVLIIACFVGLAALASGCTLCCLHRRFRQITKKTAITEAFNAPPSISYMTTTSQPRMYAEPIYST